MSTTIRISEVLIPLIDELIKTVTDEFGDKQFDCRKDVVDESVKNFLKVHAPEVLESVQTVEVPASE